jgi:hypothetical protein
MKLCRFSSVPGAGLALSLLLVGVPGAYVRGAEAALTGEAGAARMEAVRNEVVNVRSNIFITLVQLNEARGQPNPSGQQFQVFTNQLVRMEELAKAFGKRAEEIKQRGNAYFADWEASTARIQDPDQRRRAEQHYGDRKKSYDTIGQCMQDARKSFLPFVEGLTKMKDLMQGQLDDARQATLRDLFMQANWHCIDIQRSLMQIEGELDNLAASFRKDGAI